MKSKSVKMSVEDSHSEDLDVTSIMESGEFGVSNGIFYKITINQNLILIFFTFFFIKPHPHLRTFCVPNIVRNIFCVWAGSNSRTK